MGKFGSRKFIVTMTAMVMALGAAAGGVLSGDLAVVLGAGIGAYNWANVQVSKDVTD